MKNFQGESQGDTYDWDRAGLPGSWAVGPLSVPGFHFRPRYHYSRYRCQAQVTRGCRPQAETREPPSSSLPKAGGGRRGRQQGPAASKGALRSPAPPSTYGPQSTVLIFSQRVPEACCPLPGSLLMGTGWAREGACGVPAGPPALSPPCLTTQPIALTSLHLPFQLHHPLKALV